MNKGWGWRRDSRTGACGVEAWLKPFVAAAPWLTLGALLLMMQLVSGSFVAENGILFDLPRGEADEGASTSLVALVMPMTRQTMVFFDDARYVLGEDRSEEAFRVQLAERAAKLRERTLLVMADRRVSAGELVRMADLARAAGLESILFAEKHDKEAAE